jgi:ABC-type nickel/cobalt efflux system permease component RcnA
MKLAFVYRAPVTPAAAHRLVYRDENFADRPGWREVVARTAPGLVLAASSVPERDRSRALSEYPADLLDNPPQVSEADLVVERDDLPAAALATTGPPITSTRATPPRTGDASSGFDGKIAAPGPGGPTSRSERSVPRMAAPRPAGVPGPAMTPAPERPGQPAATTPGPSVSAPATAAIPTVAPEVSTRAAGSADSTVALARTGLTDLMTRRDMGTGLLLFTLATAAALGAFHALEPGHGKTVVAAYLVGSRGTAWHAVLLGLAVTVSHTAGVFLLGAVTLYASRYVMPDRLYPWLGAISGLAIAGVGLALLRQRWPGQPHGHSHDHHAHSPAWPEHPHGHDHTHDGEHEHHHHHHHVPEGPVSARSLLAMGLSGGIVPCPGALVVLLAALAWRRLGLGILLVVAFSAGLAAVLVAVGILVVHARRLLGRIRGDGPLTTRWLPLASSAVITVLGFVIAWQALAGSGIIALPLG